MGDRLKVVAIDDDALNKSKIREMMPDYVDLVSSSFGEGVKDAIRPEKNGRKTDLIIMNADDERGYSLRLFDWLKNDVSGAELNRIPVILLTKDEFSDHIMSFLEIDDVELYEGEPDGENFYIFMMDVLDRAEKEPEPRDFPVYYSGEKDADRIVGLSVKPLGEDEDTIKRTIVLAHDEQKEHLEMALERGRKKQEMIRDLFDTALIQKEEKAKKIDNQPTMKPSSTMLHNLDATKVQSILADTGTDAKAGANGEKTIVVVDNDPTVLSLINMYLSGEYKVVTLNSAMRAIDYFVRSEADLLLVNYTMPLLNGSKIMESIRWQPNGKKVPIIFMTNVNPDLIRDQCSKENVLGILSKPITKEALSQALSTAFEM